MLTQVAERTEAARCLKRLLEKFTAANDGSRSVPLIMVCDPDSPVGYFDPVEEPVPHLWYYLDCFIDALDDPALNAVNEKFGMDGSD